MSTEKLPLLACPREDCSPAMRRWMQQVTAWYNDAVRKGHITLTGIEQYGLFADSSLSVGLVGSPPFPLYDSIDEILFDGADGFSITNPSAGVVRIDLTVPPPPPPPTLTVTTFDGSPNIPDVGIMHFNEDAGFIVSDGGFPNNAFIDFLLPPDSLASITTGNTATALSGSITDEVTEELRAVTPMLEIAGDTPIRTIAIPLGAFTKSLDPVTKICLVKKSLHASGTVTVASVDYPVTVTLTIDDTPDDNSVQIIDEIPYQTTNVTLLDGSTIGDPECNDAAEDCCSDCDCACDGIDAVDEGVTTFSITTMVDQGQYSFTKEFVFCPPNGSCDWIVTFDDLSFADFPACGDIGDSHSNGTFASSAGGQTCESHGEAQDSVTVDFNGQTVDFANGTTITIAKSSRCEKQFFSLNIVWSCDSAFLTPTLNGKFTIACA